ncbi:MAG: cell wall hydrolase [Paracoccaceae bacterium]
MRGFKKLFGAALTLLVCSSAVGATDAALKELQKIETQGLQGLTSDKVKDLLTVPNPRKVGVEFTKNWLDAQPKARGGEDLKCLSQALYFEARGETVRGQFAVAEVIMNRVKSARFPDTVCAVINQGTGRKFQCQFTYTCDGKKEIVSEPRAYDRVSKVARLTLDGQVPALTEGATHYHTTAVRPNWAKVYTRTAKIGVHIFYRHTFRSASN